MRIKIVWRWWEWVETAWTIGGRTLAGRVEFGEEVMAVRTVFD